MTNFPDDEFFYLRNFGLQIAAKNICGAWRSLNVFAGMSSRGVISALVIDRDGEFVFIAQ